MARPKKCVMAATAGVVGEDQCKKLLMVHGATPSVLGEAQKVGISFSTILALLIQYGPQAYEIIQKIIDAMKKKPATE